MSLLLPLHDRRRVIGTCIVSDIPYIFLYSYSQFSHEPVNVRHYHYEFFIEESIDLDRNQLCPMPSAGIHMIEVRGRNDLVQVFGFMTYIEDVFLAKIESTMERVVADYQYETE